MGSRRALWPILAPWLIFPPLTEYMQKNEHNKKHAESVRYIVIASSSLPMYAKVVQFIVTVLLHCINISYFLLRDNHYMETMRYYNKSIDVLYVTRIFSIINQKRNARPVTQT